TANEKREIQPAPAIKIDRLSPALELMGLQFAARSNEVCTIQFKESLNAGSWAKLLDVVNGPFDRWELVADPFPVARSRFYRLLTPQMPGVTNAAPVNVKLP